MMREVFFRGKVTEQDAKNHSSLFAGDWVSGGIIPTNPPEIVCDSGTEFVVVDPDTVGQFTGAKDANGKKICEHDIVEFSDYDSFKKSDLRYRGVVTFRNGTFWVLASPSFEDEYMLQELVENPQSGVTVLGNVHDAPELLPEYVPELLTNTSEKPESCADCANFRYECFPCTSCSVYLCEKEHKTIPDEDRERPIWCPLDSNKQE